MAFISYGRIDKKLFLVVAMILLKLIDLIINSEVPSEYANGILFIFEEELGPIITGIILYFVFKNQTKEKKESKKSIKYIIILILSRGFNICYEYFYIYLIEDEKYNYYCLLNTANGIEIIIITFAASVLLKYRYYAHHKICMIIYCVSGITIDIILGNYKIPNYTYIAIYIIFICNEIFLYVYIKYMMDKLYYQYTEIIIYWGLIGLAFKLIFFAYLLIIEMNNDYSYIFEYIYEYFTETNIYIIIFYQFFYYVIISSIVYLFLILMIYYLQPNYTIIIEFFVLEISIFYEDINNKYYTIIPFILQILALLFYFEILEFNFCNLNYNTIKNIQFREEDEILDKLLVNKEKIELPGGEYELDFVFVSSDEDLLSL